MSDGEKVVACVSVCMCWVFGLNVRLVLQKKQTTSLSGHQGGGRMEGRQTLSRGNFSNKSSYIQLLPTQCFVSVLNQHTQLLQMPGHFFTHKHNKQTKLFI